jgi:hypothetical protein
MLACGASCGKNHKNTFFDPKTSTTASEFKPGESIGGYTCGSNGQ